MQFRIARHPRKRLPGRRVTCAGVLSCDAGAVIFLEAFAMLSILSRLFSPAARQGAAPCPPSPAKPSRFDAIRISTHAVPALRRAAGFTRFDLIELFANGHYRCLRARAIGSCGPWACTPEARAALAGVARELHLLVFDPEREAFFVAYAKADAQARLTVTGVVLARQYEHARWRLLPLQLYRALCAQAFADPVQQERILAAALGERDLDRLPLIYSLQDSKRDVWVEITLDDGREKRLGLLPFALKQERASDLPQLGAFWDWVQSTRVGKAPIAPDHVTALRLLGWRDPYDVRLVLR